MTQGYALAALARLFEGENDAARQPALAAGALQLLNSAMQRHANDANIIAAACKAIRYLVQGVQVTV